MSEGLILAAGLGTRLRPLTNDRPKALVEIGGKTLLEIAVGRLAEAGIKRCVVNVHSFGDMLIDYISSRQWPCEVLISDERKMLLDTGGALKHAAPHFTGNKPVLVHNVDILSDIDFKALEHHHLENGNLVTLCVSRRETKRMLLFDKDGHLVGRAGEADETGCTKMAFSGVSMLNPKLFPLLPPDDHPYPVIDAYLELAKSHAIGCFEHSAERWLDVGTPEKLSKAICGQ
ncbi:MAG: nucleotidyltransferase family protein [Bacteroidales bacterium]|nr:nucleotidyltransferase family protein [Bacteroidales bacterium]